MYRQCVLLRGWYACVTVAVAMYYFEVCTVVQQCVLILRRSLSLATLTAVQRGAQAATRSTAVL